MLLLRFLWRWQAGLQAPTDELDRQRWWAWGSLALMGLLLPFGVLVVGPGGLPVELRDLYGLALLWPIALGLVLAGIAYRLIRDRETPRVTEGDLAVLAEAAWSAARRTHRSLAVPPPRPRRMPARLRVLRLKLRQHLEDAERILTRWETIGLLFSAAMLGLYLTLLVG